MKPLLKAAIALLAAPAAFGRLRVETVGKSLRFARMLDQPPSGGCVLKRPLHIGTASLHDQPPSGGCVLKHK